jgi:hypothetical protein
MAYTPIKNSIVSELNSSASPIASSGQFLGEWEEVFAYFGDIVVSYNLSSLTYPFSASCTIHLEFSQNGTDIIKRYSEQVSSWTEDGRVTSSKPIAKYFRVRFQNQSVEAINPTIQTVFTNSPKQLRSDPDEGMNPNDDVVVTKAFLAMTEQNGDIAYPSSKVGNLKVDLSTPLSGFGELMSVNPTPISQFNFVYGINDFLMYTESYNAPAIDSVTTEARIRSGVNPDSSSILRTRIPLHYRPGQASEARFTARFTNSAVDSSSMAGVGNPECGYYFGYNETQFGIFHLNGGRQEIQRLVIGASATSSGNITVTLDGEASGNIAIADSDAEAVIAAKIAQEDFSAVGYGWDAYALGPAVYFTSRTARDAVGSFALNEGTTGTSGVFTEITSGVAPDQTFISQADWNIDIMNGTGTSGMTLAPQNGNVYSITAQYLGFGAIFFSIEDSSSGRFYPVHIIRYANSNQVTNLNNPALYVSWQVRNFGNDATNIDLRGASGASFIHGVSARSALRFSTVQSKSSVTTARPIFTIRAGKVLSDRVAHSQLQLEYISAAVTTGTKPVRVYVYKGGTLGTDSSFSAYDNTISLAEIDNSATTYTSGVLLHSFIVPRDGSIVTTLKDLNINCESGEIITFVAETSVSADVFISLTWSELQ